MRVNVAAGENGGEVEFLVFDRAILFLLFFPCMVIKCNVTTVGGNNNNTRVKSNTSRQSLMKPVSNVVIRAVVGIAQETEATHHCIALH